MYHQRVALVTGAARGIGAAVVREFRRQDYAVAAHYWGHETEARQLAEELDPDGRGFVRLYQKDFRDLAEVADLGRTVLEDFGRLDVLVNNAAAGVVQRTAFDRMTLDDWDQMLRVNVTAPFLLAQRLGPIMRQQGWGRIVNIASVNWRTAYVKNAAYIASKAALVGLTRALARELGTGGVTVNAVAPGDIRTEAATTVIAVDDPPLPFQCLPRPGRVADVVSAVLYLADNRAGFVTGQVLVVDGGWVL